MAQGTCAFFKRGTGGCHVIHQPDTAGWCVVQAVAIPRPGLDRQASAKVGPALGPAQRRLRRAAQPAAQEWARLTMKFIGQAPAEKVRQRAAGTPAGAGDGNEEGGGKAGIRVQSGTGSQPEGPGLRALAMVLGGPDQVARGAGVIPQRTQLLEARDQGRGPGRQPQSLTSFADDGWSQARKRLMTTRALRLCQSVENLAPLGRRRCRRAPVTPNQSSTRGRLRVCCVRCTGVGRPRLARTLDT